MEELTDKRVKPLKDSLTLQLLLQVYSHVLPLSQPWKIVVCLQVTWKEKKNPGSSLYSWGEELRFPPSW